ncbi:MAG: hypothetical protein PUF01_09080, partial [Eubacteriales bacterium]|nr:hypothetical protein [Eubacteriales bacterium]
YDYVPYASCETGPGNQVTQHRRPYISEKDGYGVGFAKFASGVNLLGCNGIYNSFSLGPKVTYDTMPFGFKNQVILASINFTQKHMQTAIELLCDSKFDTLVELIDKEEFINDPIDAYENKIYSKGAPLKTAVIWNGKYIDKEV